MDLSLRSWSFWTFIICISIQSPQPQEREKEVLVIFFKSHVMSYKKEAANKLKFPLPFTAREGKREKSLRLSLLFSSFFAKATIVDLLPFLSLIFFPIQRLTFIRIFRRRTMPERKGCVCILFRLRGRERTFIAKRKKSPLPSHSREKKIPDFISTDACRVRREGRDRRLIFLQATIKTDRLKGELLVGRSVIYFLANRSTRKIKRVWFFFFRFSVRETVGAVVNFARNYTSTKFMRSAAASILSSKRIDLLRSNKNRTFCHSPPLCYNNGHAPDTHKKKEKFDEPSAAFSFSDSERKERFNVLSQSLKRILPSIPLPWGKRCFLPQYLFWGTFSGAKKVLKIVCLRSPTLLRFSPVFPCPLAHARFCPFFPFLFLSNRCVCLLAFTTGNSDTFFPAAMKGTLHMPLNTRTYTNMRRRRNICMGVGHVERRIPLFVDRYCTGNCYVGDYGAQTAISHIKAIKNKNIPISPIFSSVIPRSMSLFRKGR